MSLYDVQRQECPDDAMQVNSQSASTFPLISTTNRLTLHVSKSQTFVPRIFTVGLISHHSGQSVKNVLF